MLDSPQTPQRLVSPGGSGEDVCFELYCQPPVEVMPDCLRNSDCGEGFECVNGTCAQRQDFNQP